MQQLEMSGWQVLASSADLALRHVFHARVGAYNLALWRSDDGQPNAWENRCPHRSVPLSMGQNLGQELRCQYHGWRFAGGSGQCTRVPAQVGGGGNPAVCVNTFDCVEHDGWVWVALRQAGPLQLPPPAAPGTRVALRALPVHASADVLQAELASALAQASGRAWVSVPGNEGGGAPLPDQAPVNAGSVQIHGTPSGASWYSVACKGGALHWQVQWQSQDSCILHARWQGDQVVGAATAQALQRRWNAWITALRSRLEASAQARLSLVLPEPVAIPLQAPGRPRHRLVQVLEKVQTAQDVFAFRLGPTDGMPLPAFTAGAHIEVLTPAGLLRHYSLVNGPAERSWYQIGVKREPASRGGSTSLCDAVQPGSILQVGHPVNRFALHSAPMSLLFAGGIGITPLLAMAQQLHANGQAFALHWFVRDTSRLAFADRLAALGGAVQVYAGLGPEETLATVQRLLTAASVPVGSTVAVDSPDPVSGPVSTPVPAPVSGSVSGSVSSHVYVCGPTPLMSGVQAAASALGWSPTHIHSEHFGSGAAMRTAPARPGDQPFDVVVQPGGHTLTVPVGQSIAQTLKQAGFAVNTACEQGACGTCLTPVLDGVPDHRDVYLSSQERAGNQCMLVCVSRAQTARLVLDVGQFSPT